MASVANASRETVFGDRKVVFKDVTLSASYPTGGESLTPSDLGLGSVAFVQPDGAANGFIFKYDYATEKLKVFSAGTSAHTHTENTEASYTQNATTLANTATDAQEVANGTDLSAVTVRVLAVAESA